MLDLLKQYAFDNHIPIVREQTGRLLQKTCHDFMPKNILEIGTAIGYSTLLMLEACPSANVTTIEKDDKCYEIALNNFKQAGKNKQINAILGDAGLVLPKLVHNGEKFNLIFLDGPKAQYVKYLPYLKELLAPNGVLFADDIYFHGLVKSKEEPKHKNRAIVKNLRMFISNLENDSDLSSNFYDIEDGISISIKK